MEAIYLFLLIIFIPLLIFFWTVTTLIIYCNPGSGHSGTFPEHLMRGTCTWIPDQPEPLINLR